ncbi:MAG TPA: hypothetical protein PLQ34_09955 [Ferrovaceae bacterium]|nr:hypothetical protein [Ferrovaceae bacterium]
MKFDIKKEKVKHIEPKNYVVEKDFQKEKKKVMELHKELEAHERMSMGEAHPIPSLRHK